MPIRLVIPDLAPVTGLDALDDIARAQLAVASRLYGGVEHTAEEVFAVPSEELDEGERIAPAFLDRGRVFDADGNHLYDLYFYNVDSGTFFARGTTDVVAQIIQLGIECDDDALNEALGRAFDERARFPRKPGAGGSSPLAAYQTAIEAITAPKPDPEN